MSRDDETLEPHEEEGDEYTDFVPAVFARAIAEAELYRELLNDHDIPALIGTDEELDEDDLASRQARSREMTHGVPVLVPEALLDEASEIIADREDLDEFGTEGDEQDEEDEDEGFGLDGQLDEGPDSVLDLDEDDSDEQWDDEDEEDL